MESAADSGFTLQTPDLFRLPIKSEVSLRMNDNQRRLSRTAALAIPAFALVFLTLLSPTKVHADPIAITGGSYTMINPFRTSVRFNFFVSDLQGTNFRARTQVSDEGSQRLGSNCAFPCTTGSSFNLNGPRQIAQFTPTGLLELGGQGRFGFFAGSQSQFDTGSVTIPLDAGSELTLSTFFSMTGTISFQEYDLQGGGFTGFTFTSGIFGSGIADISIFFSQTTRQYEVSRVQYTFQPEPIPEPVTLLLLGTGLAGIAAKGYKRKRARNERFQARRDAQTE